MKFFEIVGIMFTGFVVFSILLCVAAVAWGMLCGDEDDL